MSILQRLAKVRNRIAVAESRLAAAAIIGALTLVKTHFGNPLWAEIELSLQPLALQKYLAFLKLTENDLLGVEKVQYHAARVYCQLLAEMLQGHGPVSPQAAIEEWADRGVARLTGRQHERHEEEGHSHHS